MSNVIFRLIALIALATVVVGFNAVAQERSGQSKDLNSVSGGGLVIEDLSTQTAAELAQLLAGSGVVISNATFTGDNAAGGTYTGGATIIGLEEGVLLGSGSVSDVVGPNTVDDVTTSFGTPGDSDLDTLSGFTTFDAAVLEFDIVPDADTLFISYVFSSDEYNEFVNSEFNDAFAFFVNDTNCAVIDGAPVTINTVNGGNPFGDDGTATNPLLYRNNDLEDGGGSIDTEMDGLTEILVCEASVTPDTTNTVKLAIADASDAALDSTVFLQAGGVTTGPPPGALPPPPSVPTLSNFGLVLLALVMLILAFIAYRQRA